MLHFNNKITPSSESSENPVSIPTFPINDEIESNTSLGFSHNATQLTVNVYASIKTLCSGNIFDRKIVKD